MRRRFGVEYSDTVENLVEEPHLETRGRRVDVPYRTSINFVPVDKAHLVRLTVKLSENIARQPFAEYSLKRYRRRTLDQPRSPRAPMTTNQSARHVGRERTETTAAPFVLSIYCRLSSSMDTVRTLPTVGNCPASLSNSSVPDVESSDEFSFFPNVETCRICLATS